MLWNDLREFLARLESLGELRHVAGASWQEDIGAITELMVERNGKTLLFDDIPGYPHGFRVLSNAYGTARRTAIAGRCAPETGVSVVPGTAVWALDPRIPPDKRIQPDAAGRPSYTAHNAIINACRPFEWKDDFPPVAVNGPELRQRTLKTWAHLFE